jgi:hypothetical protein
MTKKIKLKESDLVKLIQKIVEQDIDGVTVRNDSAMVDIDNVLMGDELDDELEKILTPEEVMGLMDEQIDQLQTRVQYMEELNADVLEFIGYLMGDLEGSDVKLRKSKQKLRALETRAGREIFWLKSRRL